MRNITPTVISEGRYLKGNSPETDFYWKEFSYNVPENEFKQSQVYPYPDGKWKDSVYKGLIEMARKNKQLMRAHSPISPQCSKWVRNDERTPEELEGVLVHYMTNICKDIEANKDVIKWMDVVNETVASNKMSDSKYQYNRLVELEITRTKESYSISTMPGEKLMR